MNWWIVHRHLKGLEGLLSYITKFKPEYQLELIMTEELRAFRRLFKPECHSDAARALQKEIELLMTDIRHFVNDLWAMLQTDGFEFVRRGIEALDRLAISQMKESNELSELDKLLNPEHRSSSIPEKRSVLTEIGLWESLTSILHHFLQMEIQPGLALRISQP
ncbi:hypothetical protein DL95DRAFT_455180 [Leptodontidium sp. 2 PMI_412]|nr:hypothetical protein DL95DRAFT_455180 [Leptodontidium sp. 2 PMI_412]